MNRTQAACNYALLRFLPYRDTGEFVNVGVVVNCLQPCFLDFLTEKEMPERVKALFPRQDEKAFAAATEAIRQEVERLKARIRDPKSCLKIFEELVRPSDNTFRFGEVRTALTTDPQNIAGELFDRYVRMIPAGAVVL